MLWNKKNQQRTVDIKSNFQPVSPRRFSIAVPVLLTLLVTAVGTAGYFYWQYRNAQPGVADTKETKALVETIGDLMLLPEGEEPTLATVTDKEKLADQPFFLKAENGDKVLIYSNSGRAVLYRPSLKKIIDVTAVNITPPGSTQTQATDMPNSTSALESQDQARVIRQGEPVSLSIRVAIYNGSGKSGAATVLEKEIKDLYPGATFPSTTLASEEYEKSTVVDLTGSNSVISQAFANLVHGNIGALPSGETAPANADVLIIIGKAH